MNVYLIAAITIDGFIAQEVQQSPLTWSTKADLNFYIGKTTEDGIVIMGRRTYDTFQRPLKGRKLIVWTHNPEEVKRVEGVEATNETPVELIKRLADDGVKAVAVSGGSSVYRHFLEAGIVTDVYLSVIPKSFGTGISLFDGVIEQNFELLESSTLEDGQTVLLHYRVI